MADIKTMIETVNSTLHANEPGNISVDTYSKKTGYKPQAIMDAMFEAFPVGDWGFEEISNEISDGLAIAQVRVWFKDIAFQPTAWGQARVTKGDAGDAKKGAQTDAIKKALSYFTIGNRAYQGLLIAPPEEQQQAPRNAPMQRPQAPKPAPAVTSIDSAPAVSLLRKQALELYPNKPFGDIYKFVMKRDYTSDDAVSPDDAIAIKKYLDNIRANRAKQADKPAIALVK